MKTQEINIRDPYILLHGDVYYLYGTRSATCWGEADGFDCYRSRDLEDWEGPFEVFRRPEGFFADRSYWAPECYAHNGRFYLIATLGSGERKKGIYALTADSPMGPFSLACDRPLTPEDWSCIDGSLFWDRDQTPYLLFSHSFEDVPTGDMCALALSDDLCRAVSEPIRLFSAAEAPWAEPVPFAEAEFGMTGDVYFTDGPCVHRAESGALIMLWSGWSERGYAVGTALSPSGALEGPWEHLTEKLFPCDGGHGMLFRDKSGRLNYTLHYPNERYQEHPIFREVREHGGRLVLTETERDAL
jgi:hypothetical protein